MVTLSTCYNQPNIGSLKFLKNKYLIIVSKDSMKNLLLVEKNYIKSFNIENTGFSLYKDFFVEKCIQILLNTVYV